MKSTIFIVALVVLISVFPLSDLETVAVTANDSSVFSVVAVTDTKI